MKNCFISRQIGIALYLVVDICVGGSVSVQSLPNVSVMGTAIAVFIFR